MIRLGRGGRGVSSAALLAVILRCSTASAGPDAAPPGPATPADGPRCDRDVAADLVTIEDRLGKGRVDAAEAYVVGLLACPEGRVDPRVHLALATIEERVGALNDAAEALQRAELLDGTAGVYHAAILDARDMFRSRWVALELTVDEAVVYPDALEYAGLVMDEATEGCLAELDEAVRMSTGMERPRTFWLVPGLYRLRGETRELRAGEREVLRLPAPSSTAGGGGT